MATAGIILIALIAWIIASAYAWSWVMRQAALGEAETFEFWEVEAGAKINRAGRRIVGRQLPVTNVSIETIQTKQRQTNSTSHSNSPIRSGRVGL